MNMQAPMRRQEITIHVPIVERLQQSSACLVRVRAEVKLQCAVDVAAEIASKSMLLGRK